MFKITDYTDDKYVYIYTSNEKELEEAKKMFATQMVDMGYEVSYNDKPAIVVRKSKK